jgi:Ca2+-transporting ATPase
MLWLVTIGLVMGVATLGIITWAEGAFNRPVALTMGVVTFSLASLFFSLATRDQARTVFSLDTLSDKTLVRSTAASVVTLILTTVFGPLQTFLQTVPLDIGQWLICVAAALPVLLASEVRVIVRRRTSAQPAA